MAVYAPSSTVSLENNVHIVGAVAAKKVVMQNYTSITYDSRVEDITGSDFARVYQNPRLAGVHQQRHRAGAGLGVLSTPAGALSSATAAR